MAKAVSKFSVKAVMNTEEFKRGVDDMTRKLEDFKKKNARTDSRTTASQKPGGGRWTDDVKAVSKDFKMLGSIMKVGGSIQAAMDGLMVATKLWKGDVDGAQAAIESMPFGIGQLAKGIRDLREEWGWMPQAWKDITDLMKEQEADQERINAQYAAFASMKKRVLDIDIETRAIQANTAASAMGPSFGAEYKLKEDAKARMSELDRQRNDWLRANPDARKEDVAKYDEAIAAQKLAIEEQTSSKISDIIHRRIADEQATELRNIAFMAGAEEQLLLRRLEYEEEVREAKISAANENARIVQEAFDRETDIMVDAIDRQMERDKQMQAERQTTGMMALRAKAGPGSDLDLRRAESALDYEQRIAEARKEGDTELVKQLQLQQSLADFQIRKDNLYAGSVGAYDPRTMSRAADTTGSPAFAVAGAASAMSDPEVSKAIKDIAVTLKKMGIQLPAE
jgi:hypothetical protein